jgi:hypothetical protein
VSLLPANFPLQHLSPVGISKLEWYYRHYVEEYYGDYKFGHFLLASYASVPALLTPDLLYKIWQNFNAYKWQGVPASIHPIAVSDMLLSPLCTEVGFELYEMDQEIKLAMLQWLKIIEEDTQTLWAKRGIESIDNIAGFIGEYHSLPNSGQIRWGKSYSDWQEIEALSYTQPNEAASRLLSQMTAQSAANKEMDLLRTMEQFIKTQKKLERLHSNDHAAIQPFHQHVSQLEAVKNLLENNSNAFLEQLNNSTALPNFEPGTIGTGITIKMPEAVQQKITAAITSIKKNRRKKIFAGVIGLDHFPDFISQSFSFCKDNAERFTEAIEHYASALHCDLETFQPPSVQINRNDLLEMYKFYDQATDGDSCVFFYSGMGLMDNQFRIRDVIVDGDTRESIQQEEGFAGLTQHLNQLLSKKDIHVLVITDIHGVYQVSRTFPVFNHEGGRGSVIFIKNFENDDEWLSAVQTGIQPEEINSFCHSLFDILSEGSYRYNYHEIFTQLKLRMSMQGRQRPAKYSFPSTTAQRMFLTGEEKKIITYLLQYDVELGWKINAGMRQGIRPSLPFMETILGDATHRRFVVKDVFDEYSTVKDFNGSAGEEFQLKLLQNALPKIKVAFAASIDPAMRENLLRNIRQHDIFYIDLVDDINTAYYVIGNNGNEYMLNRRENIRGKGQEPLPVVDFQRSPFEFIKAMEYIAQWQGVLEFDNRETILSRNMVWFAFERIEGKQLSQNIDTVEGEWIPDYAPVELHYTKVNDEWLQPALRCKATRVQKALYVSVLYLDAAYGISTLSNIHVQPGEEFYISDFAYTNNVSNTIPLQIPRHLLEKGITEVTEYMKFFVSTSPMDVEVLKQQGLAFASMPIKRNVENLRQWEGKLIDTTQTDWVAVTIPITLVRDKQNRGPLSAIINPFKGLNAYNEEDAEIFFGRSELVKQINRAAYEFRILIISGMSGSGKTSLIRAGFIPRLDKDVVQLSFETAVNIEYLHNEVNRIRESGDKFIIIDDYDKLFHSTPQEIEIVERLLEELAYENTLLLVIKPHTELLFRQSRLVGMIRERGSGKVIRPVHPRAWRLEMPELNAAELSEVISSSLRKARIEMQSNLIEVLVRDALRTFRSLPLLSLAMTRLAEIAISEKRAVNLKDYAALGGLAALKELEGQYNFRELVEEMYRNQPIIYADDLQRGRWGEKAERNGKMLRATISTSNIHNLYTLRASIVSMSKGASPQGQVAFFYSEDLENEIEFSHFKSGEASIENTILQPFTIGAYTEDGTLLELDLSTVEPFNKKFFLDNIPDRFEQKVNELNAALPIRITDDPQKGRWGGSSVSGSKEMVAVVERSPVSGYYKVFVRIKSFQTADHLSGSAAFFLHASYKESVVFRKAINGEIALTITAYQAFTIGAYTADEEMLELDLNQVPGLPEDFYVKNEYA